MLNSFMDAFIPLCSVLNAQIQNAPKPLLSELGFGSTAKRSQRPEQVNSEDLAKNNDLLLSVVIHAV